MIKTSSVVLMALLFTTPVWANGPLRSIVVFGNEKTEQKTVLEIVNVRPQTFINDQVLQDVDDRLNHSGLFKTVKVSQVRNSDGSVDLRITVTEKQLWFGFPVFQAWSGRYSGGVVFGESNLFLPATSTLFLVQGGNKLTRLFAVMDSKNIFNSNFAFRGWTLARDDDVPLYDGQVKEGEINMRDVGVSLTPGLQWTNDIQTAIAFNYTRVKYGQSPLVASSGTEGNDVSIEFKFVYDSLRRREAFLKGQKLAASYQFADTRFGSDFTYHSEAITWQQALPLWRVLNYAVLIHGEIADQNTPFHRQLTLGGDSLRGYSDRQFRGDTEIQAKQDLLFRIYRQQHFSVFGLVFYDMGLLYQDAVGISRGNFRNGTGGGLRVSLRDIIAPVFGLDAGYGIEDNKLRLYFALGLVEF